jgi:NAD(P)-dependent dehydrogenase (short-subunit alcohol dehydrogenase family)
MKDSRKVLITGASAGIGEAIAAALVQRGFQVWGTARDPERLTDKPGIRPIALDLGDPVSIEEALRLGLQQAGGFDIVINNAGNGIWGPLEHLSPEQEIAQFQVLVFGPMQIIRGVLPPMRAQGHGLVINVTSLAAQFAVPFLGAYSAAKAAMASMTWSLQMELLDEPIRFVDVRPGEIRSNFNEVMDFTPQRESSRYTANLKRAYHVYNGRMRKAPPPERVAEMLLKVIESGGEGSPIVSSGDVFQARVAPLLARFASSRLLRWFTNRYYRLRG